MFINELFIVQLFMWMD